MCWGFITPLVAMEDAVEDPPFEAFQKYTPCFPVRQDQYRLYFDIPQEEQRDPNDVKYFYLPGDFIYLSPEQVREDLDDLAAISRGEEEEIRGWQKLSRYFNEYLALIRVPGHLEDIYNFKIDSLDRGDKEMKWLEFRSSEFFEPLNKMFWNRLILFKKTIDILLTHRQQQGAWTQGLEELRESVKDVLSKQYYRGEIAGIVYELPENQRFMYLYRCWGLDPHFIKPYNRGRLIDLTRPRYEDEDRSMGPFFPYYMGPFFPY